MPEAPFTGVQSDVYWSGTSYARDTDFAWAVSMFIGIVGKSIKSDYFYSVWPVRSGNSTLIKLKDFTATPKSNKIILNWSTASEVDNAGFNLYRSESENGEYININDTIITSEGSSTQGATYEFVDTDVQNRKTYYYKLEDIDLSGKSTMHGSVSATPRLIYGIGKSL